MTDICDFSQLPPPSCSHCTGSQLKVAGYEKDYQTGLSTDWFTPAEENSTRLSKIKAADSIGAELAAQLPATGRYNKTREVYGGPDNQVDFEDVEENDDVSSNQ